MSLSRDVKKNEQEIEQRMFRREWELVDTIFEIQGGRRRIVKKKKVKNRSKDFNALTILLTCPKGGKCKKLQKIIAEERQIKVQIMQRLTK